MLFSDLVQRAVRAEIQEIVRLIRRQDRLLTIDQVAQQLSVSKDWVYRNGKKLTFSQKKLGPKMVRFSETGLQKWLKEH
jgi:excisionase family DNA binding protein